MKVLIVEPGKYPREADIEHTLEAEQAVVGGTIEVVYPWRDRVGIVCNDNGIAENLPLNRMLGDYDIIHGTFFICGLTRDDFTDLTPKQMKHYEEMYHDPQLFFLLITITISSFKVFDTIQVMTGGGPGNATDVLVTYIYRYAFEMNARVGYASAAGTVLLVILMILTFVYFRMLGRKVYYQ